ncbi:inner membrane protein [Bacteroidales bacterium]|nr:inner membrane protein [Bacteroidales bacterium]
MNTGRQMHQNIKQIGFVLFLLASSIFVIWGLIYFVSSVLGAFTIYMLLRTPNNMLQAKSWPKLASTSFLLAMTFIVLFAAGSFLFTTIYGEIKGFDPQIVRDNISNVHDFILNKTGYNIFSKDMAEKAVQSGSKVLPNLFSMTGSIVSNSMMLILVLFFMLQQSSQMEATIEDNLPLSKASISLLKKETKNMIVSNAIGIPLIMIGQSLFAGLGFWIFGVPNAITWSILVGIAGLIPIVGTGLIWLPLSLNLIYNGELWPGLGLMLYGVLIITNVDNVLRMFFLSKYADVHPLVTVFGIILGMNLFGFWGIIFGPLMISGLILLFKIYKSEFPNN